jgi:hypothetical protein
VNYTITLNEQEVTFILNVLGELPSKTGAYLLLSKINEQAQQQQESKEE